jgi:type II secretory pathway pseudopilin PulG
MFLCFPAGMILGIIAIVQSQKAQRLARENPGTYTKPGNAGMVMGIVGLAILPILALVGIMSAIAIPALLGQRARARDKVCVVNLRQRLGDLEGEYLRLKDANRPPQEIREDLERHLRQQASAARNPWDVASPAFSYSVAVVEGKDAEGFDAATRAGASAMGQCAYTIQFPGERQPGLLGGAVRTQNPVGGSTIVVKITTLD